MFEIVMGIDDLRIQLVKYCTWRWKFEDFSGPSVRPRL